MIYRATLIFAISVILAGCGLARTPVQSNNYIGCKDHLDIVDSSDWSKAEKISISYEDQAFSATSAFITLEKGKPYIFHIDNKEDFPHWFRAVDFFRNSLITKTLYNDKEVPSKCLEGFELPPMSTAEVHLIPLSSSDYEFQDSPFLVPLLGEILWNSDTGYIFVR